MRDFNDYKAEVRQAAMEIIDAGIGSYEDWDDCYDDLFLSATGNDNGSYFCNARKAMAHVAGLEFDKDFLEALDWHFGCDEMLKCMKDGPEAFDVLVRCVALAEIYADLEDYFEERRHGD